MKKIYGLLIYGVFLNVSPVIGQTLLATSDSTSISKAGLSNLNNHKLQTITQTFITKQIEKNSISSNPLKQTLTPTKAKLKSGEVYNFNINLATTPNQVVHIKTKKPFRLPNLLKYITPFAVATAINKGISTTSQGQPNESEKLSIGTSTNVSVGVIATTGFFKRKKLLMPSSRLLITYFDGRGIETHTETFAIPTDSEVMIPMAYCGGEQVASIGIISTENTTARVTVDNQRSNTLSKEGDGNATLDYGDPCEAGGPGRGLISSGSGLTVRNVEITWGSDFSNPTSNSYFTGVTMGVSFQQTSQTTTYNPSTGYFTYSIYGVQTYSIPFGPVQGGLYSVTVNITGSYSPTANMSYMLVNYQ